MSIVQQLDNIKQRIRSAAASANRHVKDIKLLAVSKTRSVNDIKAAIRAGQIYFGESYLQESITKINALTDYPCEWHFIGHCQSNKTAAIAKHFDWVHSVDRAKIAQRLNEQRAPNRLLNICLQVNINAEASKSGISPGKLDELSALIQTLPNLRLRGLMALPAVEQNYDKQREAFAHLKSLFDELNRHGHHLDTLSMGMSRDMEAAIMEGATMVRIGTDIFGPRAIVPS